jgi:hypothetical protein
MSCLKIYKIDTIEMRTNVLGFSMQCWAKTCSSLQPKDLYKEALDLGLSLTSVGRASGSSKRYSNPQMLNYLFWFTVKHFSRGLIDYLLFSKASSSRTELRELAITNLKIFVVNCFLAVKSIAVNYLVSINYAPSCGLFLFLVPKIFNTTISKTNPGLTVLRIPIASKPHQRYVVVPIG